MSCWRGNLKNCIMVSDRFFSFRCLLDEESFAYLCFTSNSYRSKVHVLLHILPVMPRSPNSKYGTHSATIAKVILLLRFAQDLPGPAEIKIKQIYIYFRTALEVCWTFQTISVPKAKCYTEKLSVTAKGRFLVSSHQHNLNKISMVSCEYLQTLAESSSWDQLTITFLVMLRLLTWSTIEGGCFSPRLDIKSANFLYSNSWTLLSAV